VTLTLLNHGFQFHCAVLCNELPSNDFHPATTAKPRPFVSPARAAFQSRRSRPIKFVALQYYEITSKSDAMLSELFRVTGTPKCEFNIGDNSVTASEIVLRAAKPFASNHSKFFASSAVSRATVAIGFDMSISDQPLTITLKHRQCMVNLWFDRSRFI